MMMTTLGTTILGMITPGMMDPTLLIMQAVGLYLVIYIHANFCRGAHGGRADRDNSPSSSLPSVFQERGRSGRGNPFDNHDPLNLDSVVDDYVAAEYARRHDRHDRFDEPGRSSFVPPRHRRRAHPNETGEYDVFEVHFAGGGDLESFDGDYERRHHQRLPREDSQLAPLRRHFPGGRDGLEGSSDDDFRAGGPFGRRGGPQRDPYRPDYPEDDGVDSVYGEIDGDWRDDAPYGHRGGPRRNPFGPHYPEDDDEDSLYRGGEGNWRGGAPHGPRGGARRDPFGPDFPSDGDSFADFDEDEPSIDHRFANSHSPMRYPGRHGHREPGRHGREDVFRHHHRR